MLCYFVNCLVLQAQQSNSTVQVLSKQKVLLDSFSIRSNQPITQLHSQVYVDYEKGNPKTFWKNLAFFTGSMALGSQLGQQLALPQATENFSNSVQKSLLFPSISLAFIPNIWHNRPRGVPDVNLRITHLNQQGIVLNTWEKALTQEAKKGPTLLDIKLDTTLTSGKIEVSLENNSKRKVAYWASEVTPTRLDSIKPTTPTTYEPFVISRVSVRRDKAAVLPEQEVIVKINPHNNLLFDLPVTSTGKKNNTNNAITNILKAKKTISTNYYSPGDATIWECGVGGGSYYPGRGCVCPDGEWDNFTKKCATVVCGDNSSYSSDSRTCECDEGYDIKPERGKGCFELTREEKCAREGGTWVESIDQCVSDPSTACDFMGGEWNDIWQDCDYDVHFCEANGGTWDYDKRECTSPKEDCENSGGNWNYASQTCDHNCPIGYEKDASGYCVEVSCPAGYEKDAYGQCVQIVVSCPEGYIKDENGYCVIDPITECENNGGEWVPNSQIQTNATGARMATNAMSGTCMTPKQKCLTEATQNYAIEINGCIQNLRSDWQNANLVIFGMAGTVIMAGAAIGSVTIPFVGTVAGSVVGGAVAGILLIAGYATSAWEIGGKYDACYNTAQIHYQQAKDKCADK